MIATIVVIGLFAFLMLMIEEDTNYEPAPSQINKTEEQQKPDENEDQFSRKIDFILKSEDIVIGVLKAPATAEFESTGFDVIETNVRGHENLYRLKSYVDSENSFGANIRSHFTVEGLLEGGEWKLIKFVFDGETLVDETDQLTASEQSAL
jgi:hypothetical protein